MPVTLETLKAKITQVEKEVIEIRQELDQLSTATPGGPGAKARQLAGFWPADKTGWPKWFDEWFQQIGITAQAQGAEKLQALMREEGVRPEDNLLSQGIMAMREE